MGDAVSAVAVAGLVLAGIGGVVISRADRTDRMQREAIGLAVLAAMGFGAGYVLVAMGAEADAAGTALMMRVASCTLVAIALLARWARARSRPVGDAPAAGPARPARTPARAAIGLAIACGVTDVLGTLGYGAATTQSSLALTSMISSLYPVVTIALARLLLGERLNTRARFGAATCLAGLCCLAAGA